MKFAFTDEQEQFRSILRRFLEDKSPATEVRRLMETDEGCDREVWRRLSGELGLTAIHIPETYGGQGFGYVELGIALEEMGRVLLCAPYFASTVLAATAILNAGTEDQKRRWLPPIIKGEAKACFAVTEPNTGLNTLKLKTLAVRKGDRYVVNGQKVWISTAQVANKILLLARTTPIEQVTSPGRGLSLFYTDFDRSRIQVHEIEKHGRKAVDSNALFIDNLEIPVEDRIGEEDSGFSYILNGMNPERALLAAEATGLGKAALRRAARYAGERIVFDRPIGKNQGVQHPLAERWVDLEAATLLYQRAAWLYDQGRPCGAEANAAKFFCAEAGFRACETAVLTHGGFGYAKEYHVERYLREAMLPRIAPVSPQLILCFIAEKVLGLPKSY